MYDDLTQIFGKDNIIIEETKNTEPTRIAKKKKAITKLEIKEMLTSKEMEIEQSKELYHFKHKTSLINCFFFISTSLKKENIK